MRERKSAEVLAAARELFLRDGYAATSIDSIAARAGVSKATVYSNFRDKRDLLVTLLRSATTDAAAILERTTAVLDDDGDLHDRFVRVGTALAQGVLRPEVLQLRRLAIAHAPIFPDEMAGYFRTGPAATIELLAGRFARLHEQGALHIDDPREAAVQFAYALVGPLQDRALLVSSEPIRPREIAAHVAATVTAFLRAHAPTS